MKEKIKLMPQTPGVYIMFNKNNKIIYIGKAKNIKKRLSSYYTDSINKSLKTRELVKHVENIEYISCLSEVEALILENNLIKKHQPKYNILLKDQKTYPYIKVSKEEIAKLSYTRKIKNDAFYFGPYPNLNMKYAMKTLMKIFQIRDCNVNVYKKIERPCLKYDLKLCNAPCFFKDKKTLQTYKNNQQMLIDFLNGKSKKVVSQIKENIEKYRKEYNFENALIERDKLYTLEKLIENQYIDQKNTENIDVFVFIENNSIIYLTCLHILNGVLQSKENLKVENPNINEESLIQNLITRYYQNNLVPSKIILDISYYIKQNLNFENDKKLLEDFFKLSKDKKVLIKAPKKSSKDFGLLTLGLSNLDLYIKDEQNKKHNIFNGLKTLQKVLHLKSFPKRIDCFDISNIQGTDPVAAMTVAINGVNKNSLYRHFNITSKKTPDDFLMLQEATKRRYSKIDEDEIPNLILIDGGKGQLSAVYKVLKDIKILKNTDIISIAKKQEEIFTVNSEKSYIFNLNDEAIKILQRLRDEAHRFGITHHRKKRQKRILHSEIEDIPGIGEKTSKKLIEYFKTYENIKRASLEELLKVVNKKQALAIIEYTTN